MNTKPWPAILATSALLSIAVASATTCNGHALEPPHAPTNAFATFASSGAIGAPLVYRANATSERVIEMPAWPASWIVNSE